jgi:hypothetical protein
VETLGAFSRRNSFKTVSQLSDERTALCFAPNVALRSGRSELATPLHRCATNGAMFAFAQYSSEIP